MSTIKKAGVPFPVAIDTEPNRTVSDGTITVSYAPAGVANPTYVDAGTPVISTGKDGSYQSMVSINTAGEYLLSISIAEDGEFPADEITGTIQVLDNSLDDVSDAITAATAKIDSIKDQVDTLDEETVNSIKAAVDGVETQLTNLTELINDESNPGVTSLRELLADLADSVDSNQSLLSAIQTFVNESTDDIEKMISGSDTLTDGSANPFKGNTNIDIMNALTAMNTFISDQLGSVKTAIIDKVEATRIELAAAVAAVDTVVGANNDLLAHDVYGLNQIMAKIGDTKIELGDGVSSITSDIATLSSSLDNVNTTVHGKLDTIKTGVDELLRKSNVATKTKIAY